MLSLLKRTIQLLPGFLLIAAVIWLAGPYLVISGSRPLETESSRLAAIVFVVLAWLAWVLFERWQARRASSQAGVGRHQPGRGRAPAVGRRRQAARKLRAGGRHARLASEGTHALRPAVVRLHRAAGIGQDDRPAQLRPALLAGRLRRASPVEGHRRHAQLRLVVHRRGRLPRHGGPVHDAGLRCVGRQRRLEGIPRAADQVSQAPSDQRRHPHHQRQGPAHPGRVRPRAAGRGGTLPAARNSVASCRSSCRST